jgi:hypothetical protein
MNLVELISYVKCHAYGYAILQMPRGFTEHLFFYLVSIFE